MDDNDAIAMAIGITVAWLRNPHVRAGADDAPAFLLAMHGAITKLEALAGQDDQGDQSSAAARVTPAVSVRKSLADPNKIVSMIDGKPYSSLKRHLSANGLTPDEYRERFGLKADYPMVAPGFAKSRSETAKRLGLGRKPGAKVGEADAAATENAPQEQRMTKGGFAAAAAAARRHLGGE